MLRCSAYVRGCSTPAPSTPTPSTTTPRYGSLVICVRSGANYYNMSLFWMQHADTEYRYSHVRPMRTGQPRSIVSHMLYDVPSESRVTKRFGLFRPLPALCCDVCSDTSMSRLRTFSMPAISSQMWKKKASVESKIIVCFAARQLRLQHPRACRQLSHRFHRQLSRRSRRQRSQWTAFLDPGRAGARARPHAPVAFRIAREPC